MTVAPGGKPPGALAATGSQELTASDAAWLVDGPSVVDQLTISARGRIT